MGYKKTVGKTGGKTGGSTRSPLQKKYTKMQSDIASFCGDPKMTKGRINKSIAAYRKAVIAKFKKDAKKGDKSKAADAANKKVDETVKKLTAKTSCKLNPSRRSTAKASSSKKSTTRKSTTRKKGSVSKTRKFAGEEFNLSMQSTGVKEAEKRQRNLQNRGFKARLVETTTGWAVYKGSKRKEGVIKHSGQRISGRKKKSYRK